MKVANLPTITFIGFDGTERRVNVDKGLTLMEAARDNDILGIEAECGGAGACATCHVYIEKEWLAVSGPAGRVERELLELVEDRREGSRLSCQIDISDEMDGLVVRLPETQGFE
jgi:2Fe-2S ferredoxin